MSTPRILITGAKGQVGSYLRETLPSIGNCTATARSNADDERLIALDLENQTDLNHLLNELKPNIIVNAAAYTAVDKAEDDKERARLLNAAVPNTLAKFAKAHDSLFVHYSTDYVFNGQGSKPWQENDATGPLSVYGQTKREGELAILESQARSLIFRTSWVVSPRGHNFVKTMLKLGREREHLRIIDDQVGAPSSAYDLASLTTKVLASLIGSTESKAEKFGIFHLANSGETTWCKLAQFIFACAREKGVDLAVQKIDPIPTTEYPTPAQRPLNSRLNTQKFQNTYQLTPRPWEEAITQIVDELCS